jgi:hypothetical protein
MSNQQISEDKKTVDQDGSVRMNADLEKLPKPPIGRTNNALPLTGQPEEPPIGRTNNAPPLTGQPDEPPIGRTNNAPRKTD